MIFKELKETFMSGCAVMYNGSEYQKIKRISFEKFDGRVIETATLVDKCGRSEVTVQGKDVQPCMK